MNQEPIAAGDKKRPFRVLVADDESTLRLVVSSVLEDLGLEVTQAANGEEALAAFEAEPFPLVFTDIVMGGMSGLQLLSSVKAIDPEVQVIVMTSHASVESALSALRDGAYDFLIKPFEDIDIIAATAERAIERIRMQWQNVELLKKLETQNKALAVVNDKLKAMAQRDGLTGLYNSRYFRDALKTEVSRSRRSGRPFSLMFLDIDHFKVFNDTNGHMAGDDILRTVAKLIHHDSRRTTVAARFGGEEFVLLLPEQDKAGAVDFAEKMRQTVEAHEMPNEETQPLGKVTLSIGVATFPEDGDTAESLLDLADRAMYRAKNGGRNRVCQADATELSIC